jgi:hypothetical protein
MSVIDYCDLVGLIETWLSRMGIARANFPMWEAVAILDCESGRDTCAYNPSYGATGLAQVLQSGGACSVEQYRAETGMTAVAECLGTPYTDRNFAVWCLLNVYKNQGRDGWRWNWEVVSSNQCYPYNVPYTDWVTTLRGRYEGVCNLPPATLGTQQREQATVRLTASTNDPRVGQTVTLCIDVIVNWGTLHSPTIQIRNAIVNWQQPILLFDLAPGAPEYLHWVAGRPPHPAFIEFGSSPLAPGAYHFDVPLICRVQSPTLLEAHVWDGTTRAGWGWFYMRFPAEFG